MKMKTTDKFPERIKSDMAGRIAAFNGFGLEEYVEAMGQYPISEQGKKAAVAGYAQTLFEMMKEDKLHLPTDQGLMEVDAKEGIPIINRDTGETDRYSQEEITIKYAGDLIDACLFLDDKELIEIAVDTIKEPLLLRPDILLAEATKLYEKGYQESYKGLASDYEEITGKLIF